MIRVITIAAAMAIVSPAHAERLVADAVVCETEANLDFMRRSNIAGNPGSLVIRQAQATVDIDASLTRLGESTRESAKSANEAKLVLRHCLAVGSATVEIIERRPISGAVKVRMPIRGVPAEVWTLARYLEGAATPSGSSGR